MASSYLILLLLINATFSPRVFLLASVFKPSFEDKDWRPLIFMTKTSVKKVESNALVNFILKIQKTLLGGMAFIQNSIHVIVMNTSQLFQG